MANDVVWQWQNSVVRSWNSSNSTLSHLHWEYLYQPKLLSFPWAITFKFSRTGWKFCGNLTPLHSLLHNLCLQMISLSYTLIFLKMTAGNSSSARLEPCQPGFEQKHQFGVSGCQKWWEQWKDWPLWLFRIELARWAKPWQIHCLQCPLWKCCTSPQHWILPRP